MEKLELPTIYRVTTEGDVEGRSTTVLGFATGHKDDIQAYYQDRKTYALSIEPIVVVQVTQATAQRKKDLIEKRKQLVEELKDVDKRLGSY